MKSNNGKDAPAMTTAELITAAADWQVSAEMGMPPIGAITDAGLVFQLRPVTDAPRLGDYCCTLYRVTEPRDEENPLDVNATGYASHWHIAIARALSAIADGDTEGTRHNSDPNGTRYQGGNR